MAWKVIILNKFLLLLREVGYEPEELCGLPVETLIPGRFVKQHVHQRNQYHHNPHTRESFGVSNLFAKHKDGTDLPVDISLSPMVTENGTMIIADIRDMSELVLMNNQLLQSQKMDALGSLTGGIAHDFNNILSSILGFTELSLELLENFDRKKMEQYLNIILQSGGRARDLISQMMVFSRPGIGRTIEPVNMGTVNLSDLWLSCAQNIHVTY